VAVKRAFIVPHAPVLLDDAVGPVIAERTAATRDAVTSLELGAGVVVLVSPHGTHSFVASSGRGTLEASGVEDVHVRLDVPAAGAEVARRWGRPFADDPLDHGAVVPLALLSSESAVCCVTEELTRATGPARSSREEASALAAAIEASAAAEDVTLICSAHLSACLTPAAPLAYRENGARLDARLLDALASDPQLLLEVPDEAWHAGGACGQLPLQVIGCLLGGRPFDVKSYEYPFGVGYLVAEAA